MTTAHRTIARIASSDVPFTSPRGHTSPYAYDAFGRLTSATDDEWGELEVDEEQFLGWQQHLLYLGAHLVDDDRARDVALDALSKVFDVQST